MIQSLHAQGQQKFLNNQKMESHSSVPSSLSVYTSFSFSNDFKNKKTQRMKRSFTQLLATLFAAILIFVTGTGALAQNAIVGTGFSSGWGGACGSNSNFSYFTASAGNSYIRTTTANGTGNQFWRYGVDWSGTIKQLTITIGSDVTVSPNVAYSLNGTCTTTGSLLYNVPNASYNYVFKTQDAGTTPSGNVVFFEVQGTVRSISSISQSPLSGAVVPSSATTVTANLDGALSTGQAVYLRYTNDGYTTSTVVQMTGSGTTYTGQIPASVNTQNKTIQYYCFTSGTANVAANGSNADLYTINLSGGGTYSIANNPIVVNASSGTALANYASLNAAFTAINAWHTYWHDYHFCSR